MRRIIAICSLIFVAVSAISFRNESKFKPQVPNDSLKKIIELNINSNPLTAGISVYRFDIHNDTLYLVKKNNLIQVNLKTGRISKNLIVNSFLNKLKPNISISRIIVQDDGYYFSSFTRLYFISKSGMVHKLFDNGNLIHDFNIVGDKIIMASRDNHIRLISKNGVTLSTLPFELVDAEYIRSNNGLCYSSVEQDSIYEFTVDRKSQIAVKKYAPIFLTKEIKNPDIAFDNDKYFVGFSYNKRDCLYFIKKNEIQNQIQKKINLGRSYALNNGETDEGKPDFRVTFYKNTNYLIVVNRGKLNVFTF